MKLVQINTVFGAGGTGRVVAALHRIAVAEGLDARAAWGRGPSPRSLGVPGVRIGGGLDLLRHVALGFVGLGGFGSSRATARLVAWLEAERPDVIHLHNLHGFYLDVEILFNGLRRLGVPVVWTLHDAWPVTGHCAYFEEARCERWRTGCGRCPVHRIRYPYSVFRDASARAWERKRAAFRGVPRLTVATPSRWLADVVRRSFLGDYPVEVLPNGVDLSLFRPDGPVARIPGFNGPVVLGVANVWEPRKGLPFLVGLARALGPSHRVVVVGLCARRRAALRLVGARNLIPLPRADGPAALAAWYRRATVFANPTLDDNLPTTGLEALACGTPVVAFAAGGAAECLAPGCGASAPPGDAAALLAAVRAVESGLEDGSVSRAACRARAVRAYGDRDCLLRYLDLYRRVSRIP